MWGGHPVPLNDASQFQRRAAHGQYCRVVVRSDQTVALGRVVRSLGNTSSGRHPSRSGPRSHYPLRRLARAPACRSAGAQMAHVNLQADLLACGLPASRYRSTTWRGAQSVPRRTLGSRPASGADLTHPSIPTGRLIRGAHRRIRQRSDLRPVQYLQYRALGKVNRTISDTYFASAMTHPARVIPALESKSVITLPSFAGTVQGHSWPSPRTSHASTPSCDRLPGVALARTAVEFVLGYHTARAHFNAGTAEETTA